LYVYTNIVGAYSNKAKALAQPELSVADYGTDVQTNYTRQSDYILLRENLFRKYGTSSRSIWTIFNGWSMKTPTI
jgi:hypothetical protein